MTVFQQVSEMPLFIHDLRYVKKANADSDDMKHQWSISNVTMMSKIIKKVGMRMPTNDD